MKNIRNTLIVISIMTLFAFILTGFIEAKNTTVQQYEFEIVTVIESVVPKGLGRSRMIAKTEDVEYKTDLADTENKDIEAYGGGEFTFL